MKPYCRWTKGDMLLGMKLAGATPELLAFLETWQRDWLRDRFLLYRSTRCHFNGAFWQSTNLYSLDTSIARRPAGGQRAWVAKMTDPGTVFEDPVWGEPT